MLPCTPDCSFYFTEPKAQSCLQELPTQPVLKRERNLLVQHRKICQTSGSSQRKPSNTFRQETGLRGEIGAREKLFCFGWNLGSAANYKVLKRKHYIYVGWRDTNCLQDFCSPQNNGKFGGQMAHSSQDHTLPFLSWVFNPDKTQKFHFRSVLHMSENHFCKATLQNYSFLFFLQHQCQSMNNEI